MGSYRVCVCFTRKFRVVEAGPPPDVKGAFKEYSEGGTHMTVEQLRRFLAEAQGEGRPSLSDAERIVEQILQKRHHIAKFTRKTLTLEDFHHYLFSPDLNPAMGSQLSSDCSDAPIIKALHRGVRVIELDIWPNSAKDDVDVLHGRTLTTPVALITCLKSIKEHAFSTSPYAVVITLEDHLTPDLQAKVAQMITETFGEMLFCPESECLTKLPSPEEMKHRIIISTKPPKEYLEAKRSEDKPKDSQKEKDSDDDVWGEEPSKLTAAQENDDKSDSEGSDHNQDTEDFGDFDQKVHPSRAYKSLIAIHAGKPKGGLKEALEVENEKVRRLSLSEQALEKAAESHGMDVVRFTQQNILRVYPKGTRFNSSNYKPLIGWLHGAQMVAFNMQGYGRSLWLMHGMFRSNGGCGYVKKPDFLMDNDPHNQVFDPKAKLGVKKTLKVKVYMGDGWHLDFKQTDFDLYSPPDFYTRVGIAGAPADETMKRTKKKEDNWTPVWNEEFTFPLTVPELALLRIEVHEYDMSEKDDFAGQTCLPVSELRAGIRTVPLCDRKGVQFSSVKLLMRLRTAEPPEDVKVLFQGYSENGTMSIDHLLRLCFGIDYFGQELSDAKPRTLTSRVKLIKCLQVIKDYAFYSSDYPVVITFEDHLTPHLQAKVAQESDQGDDHLDEDLQNEAPEYRRLIAIHAVKLKGRLENVLAGDSNKVLRLSLGEQELQDAATTYGTHIVRFTQRNLLRVYPKGTRVVSSNYNPLVGWMHGAQMVALNMQGYDKNLWRMQGMFRANGGCGYVKKPGILLNDDPHGKVFDPSETTPIKTVLKVKLYMGEGWQSDFRHNHFDRFSPPDFYAKLSITGVPADSVKKKSRPIDDEWIPAWNEEFEFPLTVPELALLRIEVRDYDTTGTQVLAGQTCLPVSELRTGIRSIPLHDRKGEKYKSVKLLMSFNFD
ncbi:hypothetical protein RJ640_025912 [Escallonia rubra]|uniref:Phosphoinositide phospholipase C n=1 Tax=Escallonia rubra TaxID=112253 RepID=A0AA88QWY0_9ASTE|nr:hypothetical protein RJ640_025912 [Escallonia rubra]